DMMREIAALNPCIDARVVIIGRGPARFPYREDEGRVAVDGNVLTRAALLRAIATVAGRNASGNDEAAADRHAQAAPGALAREEARRQGRLILVAEDNAMNQKVILQQFALLGLTADISGDGAKAFERWESGDYALLLTDLHMPVKDGYQL